MKLTEMPEICTPEQVADYLGVSRNTIYRWCSKGDIPSIKVRKVRRIQKSTLLKWIEDQEKVSYLAVGSEQA
ncbi:helix-turn-helix domain-containing protein [Paenibacillus provencensis]|uniref:Helix-turn-helix domain-containing protein n=1 Tax=Paenibacillus provencensis TaxID=441151 RepID=A0ABW3PWF7_9BACL|nr:helix-turn-helix domain-containing protein [Paenibacillus sp. MER 78]MCM3128985.1 helix-turn-helix domain-containing protein [Paenibacillus sp. MER 78]